MCSSYNWHIYIWVKSFKYKEKYGRMFLYFHLIYVYITDTWGSSFFGLWGNGLTWVCVLALDALLGGGAALLTLGTSPEEKNYNQEGYIFSGKITMRRDIYFLENYNKEGYIFSRKLQLGGVYIFWKNYN